MQVGLEKNKKEVFRSIEKENSKHSNYARSIDVLCVSSRFRKNLSTRNGFGCTSECQKSQPVEVMAILSNVHLKRWYFYLLWMVRNEIKIMQNKIIPEITKSYFQIFFIFFITYSQKGNRVFSYRPIRSTFRFSE